MVLALLACTCGWEEHAAWRRMRDAAAAGGGVDPGSTQFKQKFGKRIASTTSQFKSLVSAIASCMHVRSFVTCRNLGSGRSGGCPLNSLNEMKWIKSQSGRICRCTTRPGRPSGIRQPARATFARPSQASDPRMPFHAPKALHISRPREYHSTSNNQYLAVNFDQQHHGACCPVSAAPPCAAGGPPRPPPAGTV